jgi:DNA-binding beta-propeller fold protein YncE
MDIIHIQVLFYCCILYVASIVISPCAKWNQNYVIVAGPNDLHLPKGIFIHKPTNTLYVVDSSTARIQSFPLNQSSLIGTTVAYNLTYPLRVYVDDDNGKIILYIADEGSNRVVKWVQQ